MQSCGGRREMQQWLSYRKSRSRSQKALLDDMARFTKVAPFTPSLLGNLPFTLILVALGIGIYFALPFETKGSHVALALGLISLLWGIGQKFTEIKPAITTLLLLVLGLSAAHYRTHNVQTPLLNPGAKPYNLGFKVEEAIPIQNNRIRYRGHVLFISHMAPKALPKRVQITTADQGPRFESGDNVCLRAVMQRPPGPVLKGAYDYGWTLWFMEIGGTGYSISSPKHCNIASKQNAASITTIISRLRAAIAKRLEAGLQPREQALARTIILGERGRITDDDLKALRDAGLGHLLAISGLHMAIFAGTLFFLIRAGLALIPEWAERYPIKKWAAIAAIFGGFTYFMISGQSIPTQRAFFMITILFIAILLERPALTMRNVVLAAIVILLLRPESLLSPGFQMSFAAVAALIVSYELKLQLENKPRWSFLKTPARQGRLLYYGAGIAFTSLVATLATAPFAIYHFHQVSNVGPIGNMLAIPVFSILIMPLAVLSLCLMPLGLEQIPLNLLAVAIDGLLAIAHWTASLKPAVIYVGTIKSETVVFLTLAAMILIFANGKNRYWAGLCLLAAGLNLLSGEKPDLLINEKGNLISVRASNGALMAPEGRKERFTLEKWLAAEGDQRNPNETYQPHYLRCDEEACTANVKGRRITLVKALSALKEACENADILIYERTIHRHCKHPALTLTKPQLMTGGTHQLYIRENDILIVKANEQRRHRIWGGSK